MNDPKRYTPTEMVCVKCDQPDADLQMAMQTHPKGEWVKWEDYARLNAENRSVKTKLGRLLGGEQEWVLVEPSEYKRLKDEIKRLRRAGDLMLKHACANVNYPCYATMEKNWLYAKLPPTDQTK